VKARVGQRPVGDTARHHGRMERIGITSLAVEIVNRPRTGAGLHNNAAAVALFGIESRIQYRFEQLPAPTAVGRLPVPVYGMETDLFTRGTGPPSSLYLIRYAAARRIMGSSTHGGTTSANAPRAVTTPTPTTPGDAGAVSRCGAVGVVAAVAGAVCAVAAATAGVDVDAAAAADADGAEGDGGVGAVDVAVAAAAAADDARSEVGGGARWQQDPQDPQDPHGNHTRPASVLSSSGVVTTTANTEVKAAAMSPMLPS